MATYQQPSDFSEEHIAVMGTEMKSNSQMIQEMLSKLTQGQQRLGSECARDVQGMTALVHAQPQHLEAQFQFEESRLDFDQHQPKQQHQQRQHLEVQHQFEESHVHVEQHQPMQQHQQLQQQRQPQWQEHPEMHAADRFSMCQQLQPEQHAQNRDSLYLGPQQLSPAPGQPRQFLQQHMTPQHVPQTHCVQPQQFEALTRRYQEQQFQETHRQEMPAYVQQHVQSSSPVSRVFAPPPGLSPSDKNNGTTSTGTGSGSSGDDVCDDRQSKAVLCYTTLMVRNVPPMYTEEMLMEEWSGSSFDFLYLPRCGRGKSNAGYVFINMTSPEQAVAFKAHWNKVGLAMSSNRKILNVSFADVQGLRANLAQLEKKIRNRSLEARGCHPIIMENGRQVTLVQALQSLRSGRFGKVAVV